MAKTQPEQDRVVGMLLGDARHAAGLSQPEAARRMELSQSRIAQLELGNRRLLLTEAFAFGELYDIPLDQLDPRGRTMRAGPRARRERVDRRSIESRAAPAASRRRSET